MKLLIQYLVSWPYCPRKYIISLTKLALHPKEKGPKNKLNPELNPQDMSLQSFFFMLIPSGPFKPLKALFISSNREKDRAVIETQIWKEKKTLLKVLFFCNSVFVNLSL